jgi:carboxylesterase
MRVKIVPPKPFTFQAGERAVLLLHGFTGTSADVRMLGRFLEKMGYTSHAPIYRGHGVPPEELFRFTPDDWWEDVLSAYHSLKDMGYEEIAVAGLSLGGVFALKLGYTVPVKGIVTMCAPMAIQREEKMLHGVLNFAREYKRKEGKDEETVRKELEALRQKPLSSLKKIQALIQEVRDSLDMIYAPVFVAQARHDEMIDPGSADVIYNGVASAEKQIKWYERSGHVLTTGVEKDQLHDDVLRFLEGLDWQASR